MYRYLARYYMSLRECLVPPQRMETQAEVLADLHTCADNLKARVDELEVRAERCLQDAVVRARAAQHCKTPADRAHERRNAQLLLEERRRVRMEQDKAKRMAHLLRAQIDNVVATQVDSLIVDAMRAYSANAARLSMPARTEQLSRLGEELSERNVELEAMQEAMQGVFASNDRYGDEGLEEAELLQELDDLLLPSPRAAAVVVVPQAAAPSSSAPPMMAAPSAAPMMAQPQAARTPAAPLAAAVRAEEEEEQEAKKEPERVRCAVEAGPLPSYIS